MAGSGSQGDATYRVRRAGRGKSWEILASPQCVHCWMSEDAGLAFSVASVANQEVGIPFETEL
jgi:hypothetical protein